MSKTVNTIVALALVSLFPALTLYAGLTAPVPEFSEDQAIIIAIDYLKGAPTFSFDGIEGSMSIIDIVIAESYPVQYFITISFTCAQPGYGDRTGEVLAQVLTDHTARVVVSNGEVLSAVIDDVWDEFSQTDDASDGILSMEEALDIVIAHLSEEYSEVESLEITSEWSSANLTPENLVGSSTFEYSGEGWTITIQYPVVWKPTYSFEVENTSGFTWSGTVDQRGAVTETH